MECALTDDFMEKFIIINNSQVKAFIKDLLNTPRQFAILFAREQRQKAELLKEL
jgi:hypothetical protein